MLDAGCGTGRVAIALARRGIQVIGVDRDPRMIARARKAAGGVSWHLADLATLELHRRFDLVLLAGNVLLFVDPGTEGAVLAACARHLAPGGHLVTGFHLSTGYLTLPAYDALAAAAGLRLLARYAGWDRTLWASTASPVDQVISVHVIDQGPGNRDQTSR